MKPTQAIGTYKVIAKVQVTGSDMLDLLRTNTKFHRDNWFNILFKKHLGNWLTENHISEYKVTDWFAHDYMTMGFEVSFTQLEHAVLFKLTWGGE